MNDINASTGYTVIRSRRKTLCVEITRDCRVVVRAPLHLPKSEIARFLDSRREWISRCLGEQAMRAKNHPEPTAERETELKRLAREYIFARVAYYSALMGRSPTGVKITSAKTRFGSCSGADSLCFSWRLTQYPKDAIDYVVVHELAHIAHKNHGRAFYAEIASVFPDYKRRRALLRE